MPRLDPAPCALRAAKMKRIAKLAMLYHKRGDEPARQHYAREWHRLATPRQRAKAGAHLR